MEVYLNDLSFAGGNGLLTDWNKVKAFAEFLKKLRDVTIIAPQNVWSIPLGGYNVSNHSTADNSKVPTECHKFLCEIFKKFKLQTNGEPLFSEEASLLSSSSSVGMAAALAKPVVSIILDARFKTDEITGWLLSEGNVINTSVHNLYDETHGDSFMYLADLSRCAIKDPTKDPMWNRELSAKILDGMDFINISAEERRPLLLKYGRLIAEINGWSYNKAISDLNSAERHPRYIFDSCSKFTGYRKAYLSIDQEGPEVCYELCSNNGSHLGEISWDGKQKQAKGNHGIKVK